MDSEFVGGAFNNANKFPGANKANIPANPSIRLLDVINIFVFISISD